MLGNSENITYLDKLMGGNKLKKFIKYIRFPFFKNLQEDVQINFDFPFTVFVGQNGAGKSSALQALYGARDDASVGDFWFETDVDPIKQNGKRNCLIYSYYNEDAGRNVEILKTRIRRSKDPEYWEPSRPLQKYGMELMPSLHSDEEIPPGRTKTRWNGLKRDVLYLDFRSELSAFDKYFYFGELKPTKTVNTKQDFLRKSSKHLKTILSSEKKFIDLYKKRKNEELICLTKEEIKWVSYILGKEYKSGKMVRHSLFKDWGYSIVFATGLREYSEAFAGSGETSIVKIVHEILKVENYTLVLLDEPETSLYPGAQKRLQEFLIQQIRVKKLQIIASTHSPFLLDGLPSKAIKVFYQDHIGKFAVENEKLPEEAFYYLEHKQNNKIEIFVEDKLAKEIVEAVINTMKQDVASLFNVRVGPGGESNYKKSLVSVYSQEEKSNRYFIFDGDQHIEHVDPDKLGQKERTAENLDQIIKNQTGMKIKFDMDGHDGVGNEVHKIDLMLKYLKFYDRNVFYLPSKTPEEVIWNDEIAKRYVGDEVFLKEIDLQVDYKQKFSTLAKSMFGKSTSDDIFQSQRIFIEQWVKAEKTEELENSFKKIWKVLSEIKTRQFG